MAEFGPEIVSKNTLLEYKTEYIILYYVCFNPCGSARLHMLVKYIFGG
jgi:hypothetical protein